MSEIPSHTFEFEHSPVEFVVAGPLSNGDGVFIRGGKPGLDLIGYATRPLARIGEGNSDRPSISSLILGARPRLRAHVVVSRPMPRMLGKEDDRMSGFILAWRGVAYRQDIEEIRQAFDENSIDILQAMVVNDGRRVEWAIAPVIARCHDATARRTERNRSLRFVLMAYLVAVAAALLGLWLSVLLKPFFKS